MMSRNYHTTLLLHLICIFTINKAIAQNSKSIEFPKAILVHLSSEQNRINALIKTKRYNDLERFRKEAEYVRNATIADFKDNFKFCPVYFYIDTNIQKIKDCQYEGILLNSDLSTANNNTIINSCKMNALVYYGFPQWQTKKGKWDTTKSNFGESGKPYGRALVINDCNFKQINYLYWLDNDFFNFKFLVRRRNKNNNYIYFSKKFDLEYYPLAAELDRNLRERERRLKRKYNRQ